MGEPRRAVDWCAGAGGASLGLIRAGFRLVGAVEWDEHAAAAHKVALPGCPITCGDVRDYTPPPADLWWWSPPCQAWSTAGNRLGAEDPRNGWPWVWEAYDRTPAAHRPASLIAENVPGMLQHRGTGCDATCPGCYVEGVVLPELRSRFASVEMRELMASDYGTPQHRRRVFIACGPEPFRWPVPTHGDPTAGILMGAGRLPWVSSGEALGLTQGALMACGHTGMGRPRGLELPAPSVTGVGNMVLTYGRSGWNLDEEGNRLPQSSPLSEPALTVHAQPHQIKVPGWRSLTPAECGVLQGFPADYPWQGPKREQYRQAGNAVPPQVSEALGRAVREVMGG